MKRKTLKNKKVFKGWGKDKIEGMKGQRQTDKKEEKGSGNIISYW